ncbi:MAG: HIT family protein [Burkholderiales bacterium]
MTEPTTKPCPFCALPEQRIVIANHLAITVRDAFPVSPGHTLVIPRRHFATFFDATHEERASILDLMDKAKHGLDKELGPAAYNIGINDGAAAGQTIPHMHLHLIPRYAGDSADPRGGVRWIFPDNARYW